ncbi:MAG: hypothetical protein BHV99_02495 [Clostridium sp. 26_21]|nr:MAG: hypothetical protein BHV99_02495 [Clostridium sp. 26_21]
MNDEQNNMQQDDLENNQVTQMEKQIAGKIQNSARDMVNKAKDSIKKVIKKAVKTAVKAITKFIMATAPVSIIVIIAIILGILAISLTLKAYEGITNVFGRDSTSGDVSTSEFNISIYDESDFANGSTNENSQFSPTASGSIVQNAAEIKKYIKDTYHYRQGNDMSKYPLKIGDKDNSGYGVDCSTFVTWALIMSGYDQLKNKSQLTTADLYNLVSKNSGRCAGFGWTYSKTSEPTATAKPGDLLLKTTKPKHVEIYMGSGTYGAGSNRQIKKEGYISYSGKTFKQIVNSR